MSQQNQIIPPPVMWAQRTTQLFVTICLEDCKDPEIKVEEEKIHFKGVGGTDRKEHEVTINLFKSINPSEVTQNANGRLIELVLTKKAGGPYWPRLTKENDKFHWLKCDFNKWRDENDSGNDSESERPGTEAVDFLKAMTDTKLMNYDENDLADDAGSVDSDDDVMPDLE